MTALDDIAAERRRQIEIEGWSAEHDDCHSFGEMADAAATYAMTESARKMRCEEHGPGTIRTYLWPWTSDWWKPKDRRRDLVRAGALIVAEIERIDRAKASGEKS